MVLRMTERTAGARSRRGRGDRSGRGPARRGPGRLLGGVLGASALAALLTLALVVRQHAAVIIHQCLPGDGAAGWLGVRLALLRADAACPEGALALGADGRDVVGVTVMVALPVLLVHLAGAGLGLGLLRRFALAVRDAVDVMARSWLRVPTRTAAVPSAWPTLVASAPHLPPRDVVGRAPWRRGPPAPVFA